MAASATTWPIHLTDLENEAVSASSPELSAGFSLALQVRRSEGLKRFRIMMPGKLQIDATDLPDWMMTVVRAFPHLLRLPDDWNGPNSPRIDLAVLSSALKSLATFMQPNSLAPQVTPTVRGGVQVEWHKNGVDLEIEYGPGQWDGDALFSDQTGEEWDGWVSENLNRLIPVFKARLHAGSEG